MQTFLDMHTRQLRAAGESDERILMVGAWREAPYFTDAERAALALTEAATRLADKSDPIPDEVWDEAASHYETQHQSSSSDDWSWHFADGTLEIGGAQIVGWVSTVVPPCPPMDGPQPTGRG